MSHVKTYDEYCATLSKEASEKMNAIRDMVQKIAPQAELTFSYGVPAFKMKKNILIFAGFKNHIGIYPGPGAIEHFKNKLKNFELSKGTIRFPLEEPTPLELIKEIVAWNIKNLH